MTAPDFIYDNAPLPATKFDKNGVTDLAHQVVAADLNTLRDALYSVRAAMQSSVNVKFYGAKGDGVTDDTAFVQAAITAAATPVLGVYGGFVFFPKGVYLISAQLVIPNGVGFRGAGPASTTIKASNAFSATSLITNTDHLGNQEFLFLESMNIDGNQAGGAVCSTAVVDLVSLFVNSWTRDVLVVNGSNVGLRIAATGSPGGMGPLLVSNTWVSNCVGDCIVGEETGGNAGACAGIYFDHVTAENQGTGKAAIRLTGLGHCTQWKLTNIHIEMGTSATARVGIKLDGVSRVLIDGVQLLTSAGTVTAGIQITNVAQNVGIQIREVSNDNVINPVLSDLKNSVTIGAVNVDYYCTADVTYRGAPRFLPDATTGAKSLVAQSSAGVDRAWFDDLGQLTGSSLNGAGIDVAGDAANDRPLALINHAKTRAFAWYYPDASNLRFKYFTGGLDCLNFDSSAAMFVYGTSTFQLAATMQSALTAQKAVSFSNELVPPQITSSQDNYSPTNMANATALLINASGAVNITGFATGTGGRWLFVYNTGAATITLKNQVTSTATNQIIGTAGADVALTANRGVWLYYSPSLTKWIVTGDNL